MKRAAAAPLLLLLIACGSASTKLIQTPDYAGQPLRSIAVLDAGVLAEAVKIELFTRGFAVPDDTSKADAMLHLVQSTDNQGNPQSAAVRLTSRLDGILLAAVMWTNGWGGFSGSVSDRIMRDDASEAAFDIVNALCKKIAPDRTKHRETKTAGYPAK